MKPIALKKIKKILVVKNRALGDAIIGIATIQYLRELLPNIEIVYGVPSWVSPVFQNLTGAFSRILPLKISNWIAFFRQIHSEHFDLIIELQQRGSTGNFFRWYSLFCRVPYIFHNHNVFTPTGILDQGVIKPIIQRDLDGVWTFFSKDIPTLPVPNYLNFVPTLKLTKEAINFEAIVFGVVATRETKMWPLEYYVILAQQLREKFAIKKIIIPLSSSEFDTQIERKLIALGIPDYCIFVRVPLDELPLQLHGAKMYIGNDTGLKHICVSLGIQTYTFFGPEPPNEWHPYDSLTHPFFYIDQMKCRTADAHYCGLATCPSMICLNQILPETVIKYLQG